MRKKTRNLQPWLDYFGMLQEYEKNGVLEIVKERDEVYVTQPALHAMSEGDDPVEQMNGGAIADTILRLRAYVRWMGQEGAESLAKPFVVNVVKDNPPHDVLYTVIVTRRRKWWALWSERDCFDVVKYD